MCRTSLKKIRGAAGGDAGGLFVWGSVEAVAGFQREIVEDLMNYVSWKCLRCGTEEHPMTHASGCGGDMVWNGADVKCLGCGKNYATDQAFWCEACGARHDEFELD